MSTLFSNVACVSSFSYRAGTVIIGGKNIWLATCSLSKPSPFEETLTWIQPFSHGTPEFGILVIPWIRVTQRLDLVPASESSGDQFCLLSIKHILNGRYRTLNISVHKTILEAGVKRWAQVLGRKCDDVLWSERAKFFGQTMSHGGCITHTRLFHLLSALAFDQ